METKNKNGFLVACVSCIVFLLTLCYFGVNIGTKGTYSASNYTCSNGTTPVEIGNSYGCVKDGFTYKAVVNGGICIITVPGLQATVGYRQSGYTCAESETASGDGLVYYTCSKGITQVGDCLVAVIGGACYYKTNGTNITYAWSTEGDSAMSDKGYARTDTYTTEDSCTKANYHGACYYKTNGTNITYTWSTEGDSAMSDKGYAKTDTYTTEDSCTKANESSQTFTVSFKANGDNVSGMPVSQRKNKGSELTITSVKPTRTDYLFTGWNTNANGSGTAYASGSTYNKDQDLILYAQWKQNSSGGGTTTETKKCVYEKGQYVWKVASSGENVVASLTTESACLAKNTPVCIKKDGVNEWGIPAPNDQILSNLDTEAKCFGIVYTKYYTVKYNLDGGKFPNGETSRTVIVSSNENLISPKINPVKKDYKFIGWYNGNTKFTGFDSKITKDYELTARYEKLEDNKCTYTCNGSDVYDPSIKKCVSINVNNKSFGIVSNTKKIELGCTNSAATVKEVISTNEEYICANGYDKEYWLAYDTCKLNGECKNTGSVCERRFEATCYKTYNATEKCSNSGTGGNVNDNPQTGNIVIALVWFFGLAAIGYSFYYFKSLKEN